ncbi:MAG: estB [Thermoleophilia bacterium]|nr:estB [Thermoleophilia bacterium]
MGINAYEQGIRTAWRGLMQVAERRIGSVAELGAPLAHPAEGANPVLLVHGYGNTRATMGAIERSLTRDGFDATSLDLPNFGYGDAYADAKVVGAKVAEIQQRTGAAHVDIVGHSRGGVVARAFQQLDDSTHATGRVVTVSSANQGLDLGVVDGPIGAALPEGMQQIRTGSKLIDQLHATRGSFDVAGVGTTGVDGILVPASSARIEGAPFTAIDSQRTIGPMSRVGHYGILRDNAAYEAIRGALLAPRTAG